MMFPIVGPLRFEALTLEWIFIVLCFELGFYFLIKYRRQTVLVKNPQDKGFSALFFGISFMRFYLLIGDYYADNTVFSPFLFWPNGSFRFLFLNIANILFTIGFLLFTYYMEKHKKVLYKKYVFACLFLLFCLIFGFFFVFDLSVILITSVLLLPFVVGFSVIYTRDLDKQIKKQNTMPKGGLRIGVSILFVFSGHILTMDIVVGVIGFIWRLIGISFQIFAIGLLFVIFRNLVPFFEFDWQDKLESIYILNKQGLNLYSLSYKKDSKEINEHFVTGALSSVNIMLNELMNTRENKISIIKKSNKIVNIYSSSLVIGVLVSTEELEYFKQNLRALVLKVETLYRSILLDWNGDRAKFSSLKEIINDVFPIQIV